MEGEDGRAGDERAVVSGSAVFPGIILGDVPVRAFEGKGKAGKGRRWGWGECRKSEV